MILWSACQVKCMLPNYHFTVDALNRPISSHDPQAIIPLKKGRRKEQNITNIEKEPRVTHSRDYY